MTSDPDFESSRQARGGSAIQRDRRRGRGARSNATGRFERETREECDDGWQVLDQLPPFKTNVRNETARTIITRNDSPDISFDQSINTYRGCEHGCVYCYARPSHCYLGHSAGLDFETELYVKPDAARLLRGELSNPRYAPKTIALGTNTDPYQPIEREHRLTRQILEVLSDTDHPVGIVTKSALVTRDIDILAPMAEKGLAKVALSITTRDRKLARAMEPRATTPAKRFGAIRALTDAGIPTGIMVAPVIAALNDHEIESILEDAASAGATEAGYVTLRLPLEIADLFREWLHSERPDAAKRVIGLIQSMHGGRDYTAGFGRRQKGAGPYAEQIATRFRLSIKRLGLNERRQVLRTDLFRRPVPKGGQMSLL